MSTYVGLPVYNEGPKLKRTILDILEHYDYPIIVVNDGSSDESPQILQEVQQEYPNRIKIYHHVYNFGLGQAINTLVTVYLDLAHNGDLLAIMDADGTHKIEQVKEMEAKLHSEQKDVIIASRWTKSYSESGVPWHRKWGSKSLNWVLRLFTGCIDSTCGYRLYKYETLKQVKNCFKENLITEATFVGMFELLYKIVRVKGEQQAGYIPLDLDFGARESESKMHIGRELKNYCRFILFKAWKGVPNQ